LPLHGTVEQLHLGIGKCVEWSVDGDGALIHGGPSGQRAGRVRSCGGGRGGLEKCSAAEAGIQCSVSCYDENKDGKRLLGYLQPAPRVLSTTF
jgi:hypothetical protein